MGDAHPRLELSLPAGATSFKRSFDELGLDLHSPTGERDNGVGEGSSGGGERTKRARSASNAADSVTVSYSSPSSSFASNSSSATVSDPTSATPSPYAVAPDSHESSVSDMLGPSVSFAVPMEGIEPLPTLFSPSPQAPLISASSPPASGHHDQYRLSMERLNAFDNNIPVLRHSDSPIPGPSLPRTSYTLHNALGDPSSTRDMRLGVAHHNVSRSRPHTPSTSTATSSLSTSPPALPPLPDASDVPEWFSDFEERFRPSSNARIEVGVDRTRRDLTHRMALHLRLQNMRRPGALNSTARDTIGVSPNPRALDSTTSMTSDRRREYPISPEEALTRLREIQTALEEYLQGTSTSLEPLSVGHPLSADAGITRASGAPSSHSRDDSPVNDPLNAELALIRESIRRLQTRARQIEGIQRARGGAGTGAAAAVRSAWVPLTRRIEHRPEQPSVSRPAVQLAEDDVEMDDATELQLAQGRDASSPFSMPFVTTHRQRRSMYTTRPGPSNSLMSESAAERRIRDDRERLVSLTSRASRPDLRADLRFSPVDWGIPGLPNSPGSTSPVDEPHFTPADWSLPGFRGSSTGESRGVEVRHMPSRTHRHRSAERGLSNRSRSPPWTSGRNRAVDLARTSTHTTAGLYPLTDVQLGFDIWPDVEARSGLDAQDSSRPRIGRTEAPASTRAHAVRPSPETSMSATVADSASESTNRLVLGLDDVPDVGATTSTQQTAQGSTRDRFAELRRLVQQQEDHLQRQRALMNRIEWDDASASGDDNLEENSRRRLSRLLALRSMRQDPRADRDSSSSVHHAPGGSSALRLDLSTRADFRSSLNMPDIFDSSPRPSPPSAISVAASSSNRISASRDAASARITPHSRYPSFDVDAYQDGPFRATIQRSLELQSRGLEAPPRYGPRPALRDSAPPSLPPLRFQSSSSLDLPPLESVTRGINRGDPEQRYAMTDPAGFSPWDSMHDPPIMDGPPDQDWDSLLRRSMLRDQLSAATGSSTESSTENDAIPAEGPVCPLHGVVHTAIGDAAHRSQGGVTRVAGSSTRTEPRARNTAVPRASDGSSTNANGHRRPMASLWDSLGGDDDFLFGFPLHPARPRPTERRQSATQQGQNNRGATGSRTSEMAADTTTTTSASRRLSSRVRAMRRRDFELLGLDPHYVPGELTRRYGLSRFGTLARNIGDYMRDEDLDTSYEGLLELSNILGDVRPRGLSESVVNSLPSGTYREWATPGETEERCPICLDDYKAEDPVLKVPDCSHWFHRPCLEQWLKGARTCPVCRGRIGAATSRANQRTSSSSAAVSSTAGPSAGGNASRSRSGSGSVGGFFARRRRTRGPRAPRTSEGESEDRTEGERRGPWDDSDDDEPLIPDLPPWRFG